MPHDFCLLNSTALSLGTYDLGAISCNGNNGLDYLFLATGKHPDASARPVLELIYAP